MSHEHELATAVRLARAAGSLARAAFERRTFDVVEKPDDNGPVTSADRAANTLITEGLAAAFPGDAIVAEESVDNSRRAARTWFVDPIDGTRQFVEGIPEFAVMIGLFVEGEPAVGVVYEPIGELLAYATGGDGAFLRWGAEPPTRLLVSAVTDPRAARIVRSRSHPNARVQRICDALPIVHQRRMGSLGLKLVEIAAGRAELYLNFSGKVSQWDAAAPHVILAEAGGRVTTASGAPLRYDADALALVDGLVASNGVVHDALLEAIASTR